MIFRQKWWSKGGRVLDMENKYDKKNLGMDSKRKPFLVFMAIIAVQLVVILYWANVKSNFFLDELYSKGYASTYTGGGDTARYLTVGPEWEFNEWVNNASFKKYLIVEEDEQIFRMSFFQALQKMLTGKNYFGFLNIAESIAGYSFVSARPGILLNMVIFVIAEIALLIFMRNIKMDIRSQYLALAMFGLSSQGIGLVEYIRFYIIVIMYLLWVLNLFYVVWNNNSFKRIIPAEVGILGLIYLAFKNSQLTLIFFGAFSLCFVIALVISRKWKPFISYAVMGLCGVVFIWMTTDYIDILLHPTSYSPGENKAVAASLSIVTISIDLIINNVLICIKCLSDSYFGSYLLVLMTAVVLVIYSFLIHRRKKNVKLSTAPCSGKLRNFKLSPESGFVCVVFGTALIYTLVIAMANIAARRYFCIAFVLYCIVFWFILDKILTRYIHRELVLGWYIILTVSVVLNALVLFKTRYIPFAYIYEEDRSFISALEPYQDMDVVLAVYINKDTGGISRGETYDCVNLMSENSNIYAVDVAEYVYDEEELTDAFVLWGRIDQDISPILDNLTQHGYESESLGQNHISQAYVCRYK